MYTSISSIYKWQEIINWTVIYMLFFSLNILKHMAGSFVINLRIQFKEFNGTWTQLLNTFEVQMNVKPKIHN